ncbi:NADPH:quinone reductase [Cadophora gregata]|uniref:NADPH:quinone reductase n=1 Tax=Cadophora gregata TaxID=51156 RepID=UPI0026DCB223|nr:NADPH:quinone reductase [Cadophora gregata]KAK0119623.1 NADPH:quinone reductase [Cadophora gregata]
MSARYATRLCTARFQTTTRLAQLNSQFTRTMATSIPKTMKGVLIEKTGGVEVLQYRTDLPVPTPKAGEVLVKNDFIGVNYIDTYYRSGLYPAPKPEILGREAEGTIVAVGSGDVLNLKVGDRVVWLGTTAYAEYSAAPVAKAHVLPLELSPGVAAASTLQGLTALTLIREAYEVKKGDWVLVHAAAGGVGLWLVQLLKAVGARTIGTASTSVKIELAKKNGAEFMINYKEEKDLVGKVKEITGGAGVSVVFDSTGKDQFENDLEVVARKGSIVSYGNSVCLPIFLHPSFLEKSADRGKQSGAVPPFAISKLGGKNVKVLRPTLFNYIYTREEYERYTAELFNFIIKDKLNVQVHETYPLADIARAHTDLEGRKTTGKLLLKP